MTIDAQIEALNKSAVEYAVMISNPKWTDEQMGAYWLAIGEGWMMVVGLRKAQLMSERKWHGLALVA